MFPFAIVFRFAHRKFFRFNFNMISLKDVPENKRSRYPHTVTIRISGETKKALDSLKRSHRKDTAELVRLLIEDFIKANHLGQAS